MTGLELWQQRKDAEARRLEALKAQGDAVNLDAHIAPVGALTAKKRTRKQPIPDPKPELHAAADRALEISPATDQWVVLWVLNGHGWQAQSNPYNEVGDPLAFLFKDGAPRLPDGVYAFPLAFDPRLL